MAVNLRLARKRKARAEAEKQAAENRVRFGRSKAEKEHDALVLAQASQRLDQLKLEPDADD